MVKIQSTYYKGLSDKYPRITTSDSIGDKVVNLKKEKGVCFIQVKNKMFRISSSQNYDYESEYIVNNIFVGDSIVKRSGSDTIYIYGMEGVKYFVHQKVINRP